MAFATPTALPRYHQSTHRHLSNTQPRRRRPSATAETPQHPSPASLDAALATLRTRGARRPSSAPRGTVHLVGTGPGDPELLTLRAVRLMRTADVVLYDRLVSEEILRYVNPSATMVYVGKEAGFHTRSQEEIHDLLQLFAEDGRTVVRLKGGDPFVFGRGGEERDFLERQGIEVRAVPGITAASGIGAELGIPLTHRGIAHSVRYLTGHMREGVGVDVGAVEEGTTLVVYMGLQGLPGLVERFVEAGMPVSTPAVAVERGTTKEQRVVWGRVDSLCERVSCAGLKSPTLVIVGEVVALGAGWEEGERVGEVVGERVRVEGERTFGVQVDVRGEEAVL